MRTLRKTLCLVLAIVMVLGLCAFNVSAATSFTDDASIEHTEAVEVLTSLKVIEGNGDGTYAPERSVTRAEMAKMITIITLGADVDVSSFTGAYSPLKDIDGHWGESYIKYCYSQGIISGRGNGVFDPQGDVTVTEAAKMLLGAIGYNSGVQGYTGTGWELAVTRDAAKSGFFKQLSSAMSTDYKLNRDEAAQLIYNAGNALLIEKTSSVDRETGEVRDSYVENGDGETLLNKVHKLYTNGDGTQLVYMYDSKLVLTGDHKGEYRISTSTNAVGGGGTTTTYFTTEDYSDLLAQPIVVRFSQDNTSTAENYNPNKDKVVGVYARYTNVATDKLIRNNVQREADYKVKNSGTIYELDSAGYEIWTVAEDGTITRGGANVTARVNAATGLEIDNDSWDFIRLVDQDDDAKYEKVILYTVTPAYVSYVGSTSFIAGSETYTTEDVTVDGSLVSKSYVASQFDFATGKQGFTVLEQQTGKVSSYTNATATAAAKAHFAGSDVIITAAPINSSDAVTAGNSYEYYTYNNALVHAKKVTEADLNNLVLVADVDQSGGGATIVGERARIYYTDGTMRVVNIDQTTTGYEIPVAGAFYTVVETNNGFKFKAVTSYDNPTTADSIFTDYTLYLAGATLTGAANNTKANAGMEYADDAIVFIRGQYTNGTSSGTAKIITGEQLKSLAINNAGTNAIQTTAGQYFTTKVNGLTKVKLAILTWKDSNAVATGKPFENMNATGAANHYAILTGASDIVEVDGSNYRQYTIWDGEQNLTVIEKENTNRAKFSIVGYSKIDDDNYLEDVEFAAFTRASTNITTGNGISAVAITGYEKNSNGYYDLTVNVGDGTSGVVTTDNKTVYLQINSGANGAANIGVAGTPEVVLADKVYGVNVQNAIVYTNGVSNGVQVARVIVFDVTNRLASAASVGYDLTNTTGATVYDSDDNVIAAGTNKFKAGDIIKIVTPAGGAAVYSIGLGDINNGTNDVYPEVLYADTGATATYTAVVTGADDVQLIETKHDVTSYTGAAALTEEGVTCALVPSTTAIADTDTATITYTLTVGGTYSAASPSTKVLTITGGTIVETSATLASSTAVTSITSVEVSADGSTVTVTVPTGTSGTTKPSGTYTFTVTAAGNADVTFAIT